ncbi:MAG: branched-chain amino acid ABC transporter ATP-binding protein/permease [Magnetospirillum sp.]|nr:branched-chain amino acid ABC transporter ATP-binding protein/permease [Magnetospirillum sp.]
MTTLPRPLAILLLLLMALLVFYPLFGPLLFPLKHGFVLQKLSGILIIAMLAMSLDLLVGVAGLVSLGHAAFFGLGGYLLALMSPDYAAANVWLVLPATLLAEAVAAAAIGFLAIRTAGIYFIMVTLAFGQMGFYLFNDAKFAGGSDGLYIMVKPVVQVAGVPLLDLADKHVFYYVVLAAAVAVYLALRILLASPFGRVVAAIGVNEHRVRGLGFDPARYKLVAFTIGGTVAGLAGFLGATQYGYVSPTMLSWHHSGEALVMVILGGMGTLFGPVLGAFAFEPGAHGAGIAHRSLAAAHGLADHRRSAGAAARHRRLAAVPVLAPGGGEMMEMAGRPCVLETRALSKAFGGLVAVNGISLRFLERQVHAIIGPNGAGKSTLVNLLTAHLPPSGGRILLRGRDVTGLPAHRLPGMGVGRSYQKTNVFARFSCFENCRLAAQARLPSSMRFFRPASAYAQVNRQAEQALALCGLAAKAGRLAGDLSYGEQRQLEIGMVLAGAPEVLVLDEPLAGMGKEESERMVALLKDLARSYTLILVEHDMDAVFSLADVLTVMVNGTLLESGPVELVRGSPAVQDAYLGDGVEAY